MSSTSLVENVKACKEQFGQILELFPDKDENSSHPLSQKVLDRIHKFFHGTDRDAIYGLSRKMIDHEYQRLNSWVDGNQHILNNQSDLSAFDDIDCLLKSMLKALISLRELLTETHQILSGEKVNRVDVRPGILVPLLLYFDPGVSASGTKRFWKPITEIDHHHDLCEDDMDFLFEVAGDINRWLRTKREKEERIEAEKKYFGLAMWREMEEERKNRFRLPLRKNTEAQDLG